ncbi:hypothetical protein QAD02_001310 [Eretmocerus hayati]|uniref:Uncharacterized protein n=1 Tax=Eretmocerus hayati TaxID=131215 RepID=A0ACC2NGL1_9HYME|nr:hypothetical protein QAD02_001310 [Eretmocerus hayati]
MNLPEVISPTKNIGKSVVESFKDELAHPRELILTKRDVNEESNATEEETTEVGDENTTPLPTESVEYDESTPAPVVTSTKPPTPRQTAKPSKASELTTPSSVQDRLDNDEPIIEEADDQEDANTVKPVEIEKPKPPKKQRKPKPAAPSLSSRSQPEENGESMAASGAPRPATNYLPPMPSVNIPPSEFIPPQYPAFGFAPQPMLPPGPYYYPQPSGPAFSESQVGQNPNGASAFGGSFASASASASAGPNGQGSTQISTSTFPGSGIQQSSSSFSGSGPGGSVGIQSPGTVGSSFSGPGFQHSSSSSSSFPGGVSQQSSSSASSSSSPGGFSQQSVSSSNGPSSITIRGSFGDNESVGIEVNGPEPAAGNAAPGPNYGYSNAGYTGASSYQPYYNTYNSIPNYGSYGNPSDLQNYFQQYFAALQAQQLAFQRQIQAQIQAHQQALWDQSNRIDSNFNTIPSGSYYNGAQIASASGSIGPNGGYQTGQISPAAPGIFSRFGESIPAPSGNSYGVFSSASSSSSTGPDGKVHSQKHATVAVNDNGKVSIKHIHDP